MKLELKHLAPYLPYKLNYFIDFEDGDVAVYEMIGMFNDSGEIYLDRYETDLDSKNCKPILRPLSDLYNKKEYIEEIRDTQNNDTLLWGVNGFTGDLTVVLAYDKDLTYHVLEYLFKNHFDVFGLIEQGLAIDINTLN